MDTTGIVLGVIVTLLGSIIAILKFANDRHEAETARLVEQARTNVLLTQIEKEITEIKVMLVKYDEAICTHSKEINDLKNDVKNLKKGVK